MKIFHWLYGYLVTYFKYFSSIFTLAKFDIYPYDITSSCVRNRHTNIPYLGLAKITVSHDGTRSLLFKDAG